MKTGESATCMTISSSCSDVLTNAIVTLIDMHGIVATLREIHP